MEKTAMSISDQIREALDGRTQRWLAIKAMIPESDLSLKINGKIEFTEEELKSISKALKRKIKAPK